MRRIILFSWLAFASAMTGGAVFASEHVKATPCVATAPANLANLEGLAPSEEYPLAAGRVVAVDPKAGKVTVVAGPIARFYMEPATRIFRVDDRTLLTGLSPGDKIRFELVRDGKSYVITRIENSL